MLTQLVDGFLPDLLREIFVCVTFTPACFTFQDLVSADDEIASSLAKDVALGDPVVEKSSTRCDITAQYSLLNGDIPTKGGTSSPQVEFGDEMRTKYGFWECDSGKYCLGVKLTFVNYKQDYYTGISSTKPGIVSSKVRRSKMEKAKV